ncbi:MAG: hypothetical protein ACLFUL_10770, partial [Desulfobacteraceae bacterium]
RRIFISNPTKKCLTFKIGEIIKDFYTKTHDEWSKRMNNGLHRHNIIDIISATGIPVSLLLVLLVLVQGSRGPDLIM